MTRWRRWFYFACGLPLDAADWWRREDRNDTDKLWRRR